MYMYNGIKAAKIYAHYSHNPKKIDILMLIKLLDNNEIGQMNDPA